MDLENEWERGWDEFPPMNIILKSVKAKFKKTVADNVVRGVSRKHCTSLWPNRYFITIQPIQ